jgi:hypothetical protein
MYSSLRQPRQGAAPLGVAIAPVPPHVPQRLRFSGLLSGWRSGLGFGRVLERVFWGVGVLERKSTPNRVGGIRAPVSGGSVSKIVAFSSVLASASEIFVEICPFSSGAVGAYTFPSATPHFPSNTPTVGS